MTTLKSVLVSACLLAAAGCGGGERQRQAADAKIAEAQALAAAKDLPGATAALKAAAQAAPAYSKVYMELGKAQEAAGDTEGALASYAKIIDIEKSDGAPGASETALLAAYSKLAALNLALKRWDQAAGHAKEAARLSPGSAMFITQATALQGAGRGAEAVAVLDAGEVSYTGTPDETYIVGLAALRSKLQDKERAFNILKSGLDRYPNSIEIRFGFAILLTDRGQTDKAKEQLALLAAPGAEGYRKVLADYIAASEARAKAEKAAKLQPKKRVKKKQR